MDTKYNPIETKDKEEYAPLNPRLMVQLAAPHTWPAAILPVMFTCVYAAVSTQHISILTLLILLIICVLMQSSVNTINDYYDYIKGSDTIKNQDDPTDAVLVYNNVSPRSVLTLALSFLFVALCLGIYIVSIAGWLPLIIGLVGAGIIILYSAGKTPISYLPVGEFVSGITMGILIPLACFQTLAGYIPPLLILLAIPYFCGIGLIMFTNNTCDINKDIESERRTLSILLGPKRAKSVYHTVLVFWIACIIVLVGIFFTAGLIIMPFMLLLVWPALQRLWANSFSSSTRIAAMAACLQVNIILGIFYVCAILMSGLAPMIITIF